jgi:RNAse (barnase) inhibitor barstar
MGKGLFFFIAIILIFYAFSAIAIGIVAIIILVPLIWGILEIVIKIKDSKEINSSKKHLYDQLCKKFSLEDTYKKNDIDFKISRAIWRGFLQKKSNNLNESFDDMLSIIQNSFTSSSIWHCERFEQPNVPKFANSISRINASFNRDKFMRLREFGDISTFCIIWKGIEFHVFPHICIIKSGINYDVVDINDITLENLGSLTIVENAKEIVKGNTPSYYTYLHQRVNGEPDRRYSYNPSYPVYHYGGLSLTCKKSYTFIIADESLALNIIQSFTDYKDAFNGALSKDQYDIQHCSVSSDEYASLIRQLLKENGNSFIKSKKFIAFLSDYKVFKEKPCLKSVLMELTNKSTWDEILDSGCSFSTLNKIKDKFVSSNSYKEEEATEAFAYIAYGLGIKF